MNLDAALPPTWTRTRREREWLAALREQRLTGWSLRCSDGLHLWAPSTYAILERPAHQAPPSVEEGIAMYRPEAQDILRAAVGEALERGVGYDLTLDALTATGRPIVVRTRAVPLLAGRVPVAIAGMFQDLTGTR